MDQLILATKTTGGGRFTPTAHRLPSIEILLVEDSPTDAELMMDALEEGAIQHRVSHVEDGEEALHFLMASDKARPDLILLDYRLPKLSGVEVLEQIKEDPQLRLIPVVVMTSVEQAIPESYLYQANCCVVKPTTQEEFALAVRRIESFWLNVASRPRR